MRELNMEIDEIVTSLYYILEIAEIYGPILFRKRVAPIYIYIYIYIFRYINNIILLYSFPR